MTKTKEALVHYKARQTRVIELAKLLKHAQKEESAALQMLWPALASAAHAAAQEVAPYGGKIDLLFVHSADEQTVTVGLGYYRDDDVFPWKTVEVRLPV